MSEEIQNAALVVPRSIMTGIMINGSLGLGMILTVLFRAGDIDAALAQNPAFPILAIFKNATNSTVGAAVLASLLFVLATSATVGLLASSSRVFWAFSRDKGLPGWRTLSKVCGFIMALLGKLLTRYTGQRANSHSGTLCSRNSRHRIRARARQHWLRYGIQRDHLCLDRRSLLVIPSGCRAIAVPSLHWRYCPSQQRPRQPSKRIRQR